MVKKGKKSKRFLKFYTIRLCAYSELFNPKTFLLILLMFLSFKKILIVLILLWNNSPQRQLSLESICKFIFSKVFFGQKVVPILGYAEV